MKRTIKVELIDHHNLRLDPNFDSFDIEQSLNTVGQLSPILVRQHPTKPGRYEVVFGNRRLSAARKLGWKSIRADIVSVSDSQSLIIALTENLDRRGLSDYENAVVIEKIHEATAKTYTEIASMIGRSSAFVSQHISMLHLFPESVAPEEERRKALCALTEKHARILSRIEDPVERWNSAKLAISAGLGVRELERLCVQSRRFRLGFNAAKRNTLEEVIKEVVSTLNTRDVRPLFESVSNHFTMFSRYPPFYRMEAESAMDHLVKILRRAGNLRAKMEDLRIETFGNFAYATFYIFHEQTIGNKRMKTMSRATLVLVKEEDRWRIAHEHVSTANPKEFASLYATTDDKEDCDSASTETLRRIRLGRRKSQQTRAAQKLP